MDKVNTVILSGIGINKSNLTALVAVKKLELRMVELILSLIPILQLFYPDRWDIQLETPIRTNYRVPKAHMLRGTFVSLQRLIPVHVAVLLHFPELTVRNSNGLTQPITNLYSKFYIESNLSINGIFALRLSTDLHEYHSNYLYSHIQSGNLSSLRWGGCCLGNSSLVTTLSRYNTPSNKTDSLPFLKLLLLQLEGYFQWESLEGGPHIKMEVIGRVTPLKMDSLYISSSFEDKGNKMIENISLLDSAPINLTVVNGKILIIDNLKFEDFLISLFVKLHPLPEFSYFHITSNYSSATMDCLCTINGQGEYLTLGSMSSPTNSLPSKIDETPILFRNENKFAFFTPTAPLPRLRNLKIVLHPLLKSYVKTRIEVKINKERVKSYALRTLHSC